MKKVYTIFVLLCISTLSFAQSENNPVTIYNFDEVLAIDLAAMIMGNQATVSNAAIQCDVEGGGYFTDAMGLDDLTEGIVLTSGTTAVAFSPNTSGSASGTGGPGDAELEEFPNAYSGTFNACVLEFDFVPSSNQISLAYIFGSEEYPEWVGSSFNDAMAILITGEPEYPAHLPAPDRNIALIPNSPLPGIHVSINFLNVASYSDFFIDNSTGESSQYIQYDGMTTLLPAVANVTPGNTYRLKFAIADVSDAIYDSGLFIAPYNRESVTNRIVNLHAFWDANGNALKDETEVVLPSQSFLISPVDLMLVSHIGGNANAILPVGDYQASFIENPLWQMTEATDYTINITGLDPLPNYEFGLQPTSTVNSVEPYMISGITRCNTEVNYWLTYMNTGTTIADGLVTLETSELLELIETIPAPDMEVDGKLVWNFNDLYPGHHNRIKVHYLMPDENSEGEDVTTIVKVEQVVDGEIIAENSDTYSSTVLCAIDPNDKLVSSNLLGQSETAYIGDILQYTIRFQNTGSDTAFYVRIEDYLDKKLDWTTFQPITASHDYSAQLDRKTGLVTFEFNDIILPDDKVNEAGSQGFAMFEIRSIKEIEDKTELSNTASIFFDSNAPIVTNTTSTIMLEPVDTDIEVLNNRYAISVYPNPFSDYSTIEVSGVGEGSYQLEVMDIVGRKVQTLTLENGKARLDREELESGVYLWRILEEGNSEVIGVGKVMVR